MVYPTNVLHLATESANKRHSAAFPLSLPTWFIRLFTQPGDTVLDPFVGSGTTAAAALMLGRRYVGIDIKDEYVRLAEARLAGARAQPGMPGVGADVTDMSVYSIQEIGHSGATHWDGLADAIYGNYDIDGRKLHNYL